MAGFYQSIEDLKCKNNFVITPFETDITSRPEVQLVGLKTFIDKYLKKIK